MSDKETERPSDNEARPDEVVDAAADRPAAAEPSDGEGAFVSMTKDRGDLWRRALFMLLFGVLYGVAEFVIWMVVIVQFLVVLVTGSANEQLLRLGSSLSIYSYQVFRFLTFTGDEQPFPMSAWPADEAQDSPWFNADD